MHVAGRTIEVVYSPGHASHHVTYVDHAHGVAFVGDTAGNRSEYHSYVVPTTPPPDVNLDAWQESITAIRARQPQHLFLTHFGLVPDVPDHLEQFWGRLQEWSFQVRNSLNDGKTDAERSRQFAAHVAHQFPKDFANSKMAGYMRGT